MLDARDLDLSGRLHGIGVTLRAGEITAICGPNGAGKSSLLACLAGLIAPDNGGVTLDGTALAAIPPQARARAIGFLPQSPDLAWDVSVEVLVGLGRLPWPGGGNGAIAQAMEAMDLTPLRHRPMSHLSGGERARAFMARVLAGQPRWLLADEPLANLDLAHGAALMAGIRVQAQAGRGVVVVLHDLAQAMNHADRVLVMERGKLVADGPPAEALAPLRIGEVWGVRAEWLGTAGAMALAVSA